MPFPVPAAAAAAFVPAAPCCLVGMGLVPAGSQPDLETTSTLTGTGGCRPRKLPPPPPVSLAQLASVDVFFGHQGQGAVEGVEWGRERKGRQRSDGKSMGRSEKTWQDARSILSFRNV